MKYKLYILIFASLAASSSLLPQTVDNENPNRRFGIELGADLRTFRGNDYWGEPLKNKPVAAWHAGVKARFSLTNDIFIQPGLLLRSKGTKQEIITSNISKQVRLLYMEIPVDLLYRPRAGNGHLLLGAGPYAAIGLVGKEKTRTGNATTGLKVKFLADASNEPTTYVYYRTGDAGADFFLGYEFINKFYGLFNSQVGFVRINSDYKLPNDKTSKKNLGFGLSAGYRF